MADIKIVSTVLFFLLCPVGIYSFNGTQCVMDFDLGLSSQSPFSLYSEVKPRGVTGEIATAALYEYGFRGASQLYIASLGGRYYRSTLSMSASIQVLEAFNIYREIFPSLSLGFPVGRRSRGTIALSPTLYSIPDERELSFAATAHFSHRRKVITFGGRFKLWNMEQNSALLRSSMRLEMSTIETLLGAQALGLSLDITSRVISLSIVEQYRLSPHIAISAAVQTKPLFVHLGLSVSKGRIDGGAIFSRHSELGWSKGGYLQYHSNTTEEALP